MQWMFEKLVGVILAEGPFSADLVVRWPRKLREDYLELMALDIIELGISEFKRQSRLLGEAYLLSLHEPIQGNSVLLESWRELAGNVPPPEMPEFPEERALTG